MKVKLPLLPSSVRWLAVLIVAGFIFFVSVVTVPPETLIDKGKPAILPLDKWRHFVAYAVLGYTLAYAVVDWQVKRWHLAVSVVGITVIYGIGIEFAQSMIPYRYFSMGDAYANALGGVLVIPVYRDWSIVEFERLY